MNKIKHIVVILIKSITFSKFYSKVNLIHFEAMFIEQLVNF